MQTQLAVGLIVGLLALVGCGSSTARQVQNQGDSHPSQNSVKTRPISWHLEVAPKGRKIHIFNAIGWCYGAPKPYIASVGIDERRGQVVLTALLANPPSKKGTCADLSMSVDKVVKLGHPLDHRSLFDGSRTPPIRRWPRASQQ